MVKCGTEQQTERAMPKKLWKLRGQALGLEVQTLALSAEWLARRRVPQQAIKGISAHIFGNTDGSAFNASTN